MSDSELLPSAALTTDRLRQLFDEAGLDTRVDDDGDLVVTRGVTCYVLPAEHGEQIMLLTYAGIKDSADRSQKLEFCNRVNNEISRVRAHVNRKEKVVMDYHIPVEGGVTAAAVVAATEFFLLAIAHAIDRCDLAEIVR